jgi:hypothetical protein
MMKKHQLLICLIFTLLIYSCKKELQESRTNFEAARFPAKQEDVNRVKVVKELASMLKNIYQDREAYYEVNVAIFTGYYSDERVLLKDLLTPETSPVYKTKHFMQSRAKSGSFKKRFYEELSKGEYPNLKAALGYSQLSRVDGITYAPPTNIAMEVFSNSTGVCIYFPYSENWASNYTTSYFDNINSDPFGNLATIVATDREAQSAPGDEPFRVRGGATKEETYWYIDYRQVTVDDDYADVKATHIVGMGAHPSEAIPTDTTPPPGDPIYRVYHGWSRLTDQKDKLISFNSQNGGGSEVKVCRISGYLKIQNQQVSDFAGDQFTVEYTRKQIKHKHWKRIYGVWDPHWHTGNLEQVYAVYEEDSEGEETFSGSLNTTVSSVFDSTTTFQGNLSYSIKVKTQDEIITQRKQDRYSYFRDAKNDQGWGYQMGHSKPTWNGYDNTFLPSGNWPKWDEGTIWGYTWPYKVF